MTRSHFLWFFLSLLVYHANGRPLPEVDCVAAPYTTWSLLRHGDWDLKRYPEMAKYRGIHVVELPDGSWFSIRSPGSSLTAIPVFLPFALFSEAPLSPTNMGHLGKLDAAGCVAIAVVLLFDLCRRRWPNSAMAATTLFAFGTSLWPVATQALWMHGPAVMWIMIALWLLLKEDSAGVGRNLLLGLCLGMAILCRPTAVFFLIATGFAYLYSNQIRSAVAVGFGALGPVLALMAYNKYYFNNYTVGGYVRDNWAESTPLWIGVPGLLIAPSRGLFIYSPAFLVALLALRQFRQLPAQIVAWTAAVAVTVVFYARWHDWRGGWCYGPRFLCEAIPILAVLFAISFDNLGKLWKRMAWVLIAISVLIQSAGVFGGRYYTDWQLRHDLSDQGRSLFELHDTQIATHLDALLHEVREKFGK